VKAEAFQQAAGCKDNDLLQIEKVLLLTCIVSDLVTVTKDRSLRQLLQDTYSNVGAAAGCDLFRFSYI